MSMASPANKSKKWANFVSRLATQANFVCDGPMEVSFTNPEGSRVPVSDLSQLRQIFDEYGSDKNQLLLHLTSKDREGTVHHTTVSIRRPKSGRRRKETSTTSASQSTSEDTSQESRQTTMSSSFIMRGSTGVTSPASQSMNVSPPNQTPNRRRSPTYQQKMESTFVSPLASRSATSPQSIDQPLGEEKQIPPPRSQMDFVRPPSPPPPADEKQLSHAPISAPLSLEEQRHYYYRQHGRPPPSSGGMDQHPEIPQRIARYRPPPPAAMRFGSPFVSPPRSESGGARVSPGLPTAEESADLTSSIRDLTTQLQSLIQQQQQQMAAQTASAVAEASAIQSEVVQQASQQAARQKESAPIELEMKQPPDGEPPAPLSPRQQEPAQQMPNVSNELGEKLDALSHHITQIGSVVEKFNQSAQLIHESVQNLMTTSLCIQQQQQQLSMSMSHMAMSTVAPSSFIMTGVQTPQGMMYYPVAQGMMDQKEAPQLTPTPGPGAVTPGVSAMTAPMFRPQSLTSSYVSTGSPNFPQPSPRQLPPGEQILRRSLTPTNHNHFADRASPTLDQDGPISSAPAPFRSASVQDVLNSPRLPERSPPVRTLSARIVRPNAAHPNNHSSSDPQAQQLVIVPPPQDSPKPEGQREISPVPGGMNRPVSGSIGSLPSDVENTGSIKLSASAGSQDSSISDDLKEKLQKLKEMGHTNRTFNLVLLQQNNGDLDSVLADLRQFEQFK